MKMIENELCSKYNVIEQKLFAFQAKVLSDRAEIFE